MSLRLRNEGGQRNFGLKFGSISSDAPNYDNIFIIHPTLQPQNNGDYVTYTVASPLVSNWSDLTEPQQGREDAIQSEVVNPFNIASTNPRNYYCTAEPQLNGYSFQPARSIGSIDASNFPNSSPSDSLYYTSLNQESAEENGASSTNSTSQTGTNPKHSRMTEDGKWQCTWPLARGECGQILSKPQELRMHRNRLDHEGPYVSCEKFDCPCGEKRRFRRDAAVRHTRQMYAMYQTPIPQWLAKRTRGPSARRRRKGGRPTTSTERLTKHK